MQIDMHFYGTYALARAAGLPPDVAKTVATAAQFVDDAVEDAPVLLDDGPFHVPVPSCHPVTSGRNLNGVDQWHVWVPYHFLPGNLGGNAEERLICRKGVEANPAAKGIIDLALRQLRTPLGPHLLGIVTHVLQDTFSHAGFLGITSSYNDVIIDSIDIGSITDPDLLNEKTSMVNNIVQLLKAPGHAAVGSLPDYPYLSWSFEYEHGNETCPRRAGSKHFERNNTTEFAEACKRLYEVFLLAGKSGPKSWRYEGPNMEYEDIKQTVFEILSLEAKREIRGAAWYDALRRGEFCDPEVEDNDVFYDELAWLGATDGGINFSPGSDPVLFMQASHVYRSFIHCELLTGLTRTA